ncbi:MAG: ankyrin repeat domain-containing protein [Saprospiraceae bacterium]|nr:ankyrin repeat domain-containing protein [Saprospiraceae bacterium]MCC6843319.1 ankyrin repeat domain-containing protein [Saprospiraceae bacterium]HRG33101.1 hypothetical protein [Saprospiraceae bacterium]
MENQNAFSRRVLIKSSVLGLLILPIHNVIRAKNIFNINESNTNDLKEPKRYPAIIEEITSEVVGVSHFNLDRLKELVNKRPELARATWDWGFGDWETAIGAASHVGRKDIVQYLLSKGARPDIFTFAMLGAYETVKSMIEFMPGLQKTLGPHGISLLQHVKNGNSKSKKSIRLIDYLNKLGDADGQEYQVMNETEKQKYAGDYKYGEGEFDGFTVKVNSQKRLLFGKLGMFGGSLLKIGNHTFTYNGAPSVEISFQLENEKIISLTVKEPELILIAKKI